MEQFRQTFPEHLAQLEPQPTDETTVYPLDVVLDVELVTTGVVEPLLEMISVDVVVVVVEVDPLPLSVV